MIDLRALKADLMITIANELAYICKHFDDEEGYNGDKLAAAIGLLNALDEAGYKITKKDQE